MVPGAAARPIPEANRGSWIVAAVPTAGTAQLSLTDGGYIQTLSLPDGKPGANNIAVVTRAHRSSFVFKSFSVPVKLSKKGASASLTLHARATLASLDYWIPGHDTQHASTPKNAILSISLEYTRSGSATTRYGFDPQVVQLKLPNGQVIHARNVAASGKIDDVFEVPANFTKGALQIAGSERQQGVTLSVKKTSGFTISIPAG